MKPIYLDYNATTPTDREVADFMIPFLREYFGNPSSSHPYGIQTRKAIEEARGKVALLLECKPEEVIFTSGGTESNNLAILGSAYQRKDRGNHIITTKIEHPAVLEVCRKLEQEGFEVTYLDIDGKGRVRPQDVETALRPGTILVTIMHANNEVGTIQPISEISSLLQGRNILFHTDAAQSVGKIGVSVKKMGVDLLSLAGHKFYAPKGVGALYIREGVSVARLMEGADHERNIRPGTENVLEIAGLGKAAEIARRDLERNARIMKQHRDLLNSLIMEGIPSAVRNGDPENCLPNTLSLGFPGMDASSLMAEIPGIAASAGAACHTGEESLSHVLRAMKVPAETARGTIRFSTGKDTTENEIREAAEKVCKAFKHLSSAGRQDSEQVRQPEKIKMTSYTQGMGCACKISPRILEEVLRELPVPVHPDILVGASTSDDAAVYKINDDTAIVQTVDFFTPIIDDPFQFGAVAAANALSDIYAMGASPLFALNIVAFPEAKLPLDVLRKILEGANEVVSEAGIFVLGGHTIKDNEPKFGLVVTGTVHPGKILKNSTARPGDDLILTKPIGTGILSTALKRGVLDERSERLLFDSMRRLNKKAAEIMLKYQVNACTDVTGFGFLGHLREMCIASETAAEVFAGSLPLLDRAYELAAGGYISGGTKNNIAFVHDALVWADMIPEPLRVLLADAQTSGGLLMAVPSGHSQTLVRELNAEGIPDARIVGRITPMIEHGVIRILD